MGLQHPDAIDAFSSREGWAVLTIHHFDVWDPAEEKLTWIQKKHRTYIKFLDHPAWLQRYGDTPPKIELISNERAPSEVIELCKRLGIFLKHPDK